VSIGIRQHAVNVDDSNAPKNSACRIQAAPAQSEDFIVQGGNNLFGMLDDD
jgi:hypothetical protein